MMQPTFYIDLDRTIFCTDRVDEIFAAVERLYPDNELIKKGYEQRHAYYVIPELSREGVPVTYYHDFVRQLCDANLACDDVLSKLVGELADGRFEYPGLKELMTTMQARGDVTVLTYGEDVYQRFKVSLCPSLAGSKVVTIIQSKSEYLNAHAQPGDWIIDDKKMTNLVPGIRAVYVQHDESIPADAHTLGEVQTLITDEILLNKQKHY